MRRAVFMTGALLALTSTAAFATGIELAWNHCFGQVGAQSMRTSACTTNSGSHRVDRGQFRGVAALPAGSGLPVEAEAQQYGIGFRIANGNTVPAASCQGCFQETCVVLTLVRLYSTGSPDVALNSPHPGSDNWITWQGQSAAVRCLDPPPLVPALQHTWGQIKSI